MFPTNPPSIWKRAQRVVGDLLATALDQPEMGLDSTDIGRSMLHPETDEEIYEDHYGPLKDFRTLTKEYLKELEAELEDRGKYSRVYL